MQSKMRTNGAFLRNFDSKRYQELQQQKEEILKKQQELEKIKHKGKQSDKVKAKGKAKVSSKSAEAFDFVRSESDRSDPEKIKRNSLYPNKTKSKGDKESVKETEIEIKEISAKVNMEESLASIKEDPESPSTVVKEKNCLLPQLDGLSNLDEVANNSKRNVITVVATIEPVRYNVAEPSLPEVIEEDLSEIRSAINNNDVESIDSGLSSDKKTESDDCETIRNGLDRDSDKFFDNGDEILNGEGNDKFEDIGHDQKPPDLPVKKHRRRFRRPIFEMDVSTSSAEFDSELSFENGIVYDPKRLLITDEQLSSLYVTSSSSG